MTYAEDQERQGEQNRIDRNNRIDAEDKARHTKWVEEQNAFWDEFGKKSQTPSEPIAVDPDGCRNILLGLGVVVAILCAWGYVQQRSLPITPDPVIQTPGTVSSSPHPEAPESPPMPEPSPLPKPPDNSMPPGAPPHIRVLSRVMPVYPKEAGEGTVSLIVMVAPDGSVLNVEPEQGDPVLVRAAAKAVKQWRYEPLDAALGTFPRKTRATLTLRRK
jgi:hypothetical protein